jgi:hypothetical protein
MEECFKIENTKYRHENKERKKILKKAAQDKICTR